MAERVVVVCDVCGKAPAETVGITAKGSSYRKDLCAAHLAELLRGARAPRRGRPFKAATTPVAPRAARRRARPPKAAGAKDREATATQATKRPRRKITNPAVLEKRRPALAKARAVRADKRAAAKRAG